MAMIVAGLAVVVTAFSVEPARVRRSRNGHRHGEERKDEQVPHVAGVARGRLSFRQSQKALSYTEQ